MRRFGMTFTLAVFGFGLSAAVSIADEVKIPLSEVPKAVTEAFKAKFPKATMKNAIKETMEGKVTYEIESTIASGLSIDAVLKPDGEFVAIEKEIKPSELPAAVAPAVEAKFPKSEITKAEHVESAGKITYEAVVKKADGKTVTLIFDKNGKFSKEE
jgi:Putative beta-lactamase-inhibitor-like, PepSY-like